MDNKLESLIDDYLVAVAQVVAALVDYGVCERPLSRTNWITNGMDIKGELGNAGTYQKRGYGCIVDYQGLVIDFEFGEQGESDGFDIAKLISYLDLNGRKNPFSTPKALNAAFKEAILEQSITGAENSLYYLK